MGSHPSQQDAGLRYAIKPDLSLVAGVFNLQKPYFSLDQNRVYRNLGSVSHRGIELSLAGQLKEGFTLLAGFVLIDAKVSGDAVDLGLIGPKPAGIASRTLKANIDYKLPFMPALSVDLGVVHTGSRFGSTKVYEELSGQLKVPGRTTVDVGTRYKLNMIGMPVTLRTQVTNLFEVGGWDVSSNSSFRLVSPRRFMSSLAADL